DGELVRDVEPGAVHLRAAQGAGRVRETRLVDVGDRDAARAAADELDRQRTADAGRRARDDADLVPWRAHAAAGRSRALPASAARKNRIGGAATSPLRRARRSRA